MYSVYSGVDAFIKSCRYLMFIVLGVAGACISLAAQAGSDTLKGIHFNVSRVIYSADKNNGVPVVIDNNGSDDTLIQAYVRKMDDVTGEPAGRDKTFMIFPPLARVNAGDSTTLRLLRVGPALPEDRESAFFLTARMIPAGRNMKPSESRAQVVFELSVRMFYRPSSLPEGGVKEACNKLVPRLSGGRLILHNPTAWWLPVRKLSVNGSDISAAELFAMIPPFGERGWPLPAGMNKVENPYVVSWSGILETGMDSEVVTRHVDVSRVALSTREQQNK